MLCFMAFFFVLSFVLLMSGLVEIALVAFGLAVATPCAYVGWHLYFARHDYTQ